MKYVLIRNKWTCGYETLGVYSAYGMAYKAMEDDLKRVLSKEFSYDDMNEYYIDDSVAYVFNEVTKDADADYSWYIAKVKD